MEAWSAVDAPLNIVRPMSPSKPFASKFTIEAPPALDISLKVVEPVVSPPKPGLPPLTIDMLPLAAVGCVVEDYLAFVASVKGLQNVVIVDDAGAANNQFAPKCSGRRDV